MTTKVELVQYVKSWLTIENEIKDLQRIIREKRKEKKGLTGNLVEIMKENEIDCFDITGGKLVYTQNKIKQSLSKKHLLNSLMTYFKQDSSVAKEITTFILESRETKIKENIRHKIKKK
tara:strand:- start:193 stop:549 length:357 start_codon:yes stop_codon:yes gene_type:complete